MVQIHTLFHLLRVFFFPFFLGDDTFPFFPILEH